ncbi:CAP domain-containing protein [Laceyella putida]|uniref:CAP domain-containing protein n=2 Tax=Laceyella putida TaxID=110101 RepID=A0ABW2RFP1_9BACL
MRFTISFLSLAVFLVVLTGCSPLLGLGEATPNEPSTKPSAKPMPETKQPEESTVTVTKPPSPTRAEQQTDLAQDREKSEKSDSGAKTKAPTPSENKEKAEATNGKEATPKPVTPPTDKQSDQSKPTPSNSTLLDIEKEVIQLVNQEREKRGLAKLAISEQVSRVARKKSEDMKEHHYFSHESPTYGSPFEMLQRFGVRYTMAGENIAAGQTTAEQVMESWMNSEGHRANILNPDYTHIGVGYVKGGDYGVYWTQQFIAK